MLVNRLCLLTLTVLLAAVQTLSAGVEKPNRGQVRFADNQHIPIRPNVDVPKTKSSSPTKAKKPTTPNFESKKKVAIKPIVVAPAATPAVAKSKWLFDLISGRTHIYLPINYMPSTNIAYKFCVDLLQYHRQNNPNKFGGLGLKYFWWSYFFACLQTYQNLSWKLFFYLSTLFYEAPPRGGLVKNSTTVPPRTVLTSGLTKF